MSQSYRGIRVLLLILALNSKTACATLHVRQSPLYIQAKAAGSINISCVLDPAYSENIEGIYLYRKRAENMEYLYFREEKAVVSEMYKARVHVTGNRKAINISISSLTENDTDFYLCAFVKFDSNYNILSFSGDGTFLHVLDDEESYHSAESISL
ncbi:uncharacterized protein LOC115089519 isoform X2 [Rhinatrema bivittatum]|uniref:uncharacterized protein LOC115089519 isoform X2 n=1 Tax=Rhinatrema bivittatum TaxID=194408 RepID=UPI00112D52A8|nr:uncharacterized protein LOC115089519 isoform X2 [Rhinatrema bivittatum]